MIKNVYIAQQDRSGAVMCSYSQEKKGGNVHKNRNHQSPFILALNSICH